MTIDKNVATVREALIELAITPSLYGKREEGIAALDSLAAEINEWQERSHRFEHRAYGAEAELERVKAERYEYSKQWGACAKRADKALAALREANQDVLLIDSPEGDSPRNIAASIRAAIAEITGEQVV